MSWLSKAVHGIGHAVGEVGDVVQKAAPLATFIPGLGPLAAAGLGALGGVAGQLNDDDGFRGVLGDTLKGGVIGGAGAYGLDKPGGVAGAIRGAAGTAAPDSAGSFLGGLGQTLGITKPGGGINLGTLGALGLGAAGLYDAHKQSGRQEDLLREQLGLAREQAGRERELFQAGAPIRSATAGEVLSRIQAGSPTAPDLSGLADAANPFRKNFHTPALVPAPRRSA